MVWQNERASVDHSSSGSVEVASFSSFDEWVKSEQDPFRNRFEESNSLSPRTQITQNGNGNINLLLRPVLSVPGV